MAVILFNVSRFPLQFRQEYLDTLYRYAKFQYECGNYSGAAEYLYFFRVLVGLSPHAVLKKEMNKTLVLYLICV